MSVDSEPFLKHSSKKINEINNEAKSEVLCLIKGVVNRLKETRNGINDRKESSGAEINSFIKPGIGSFNPSVTSHISIKEQIHLNPASINEIIMLDTEISKSTKNYLGGHLRENMSSTKLSKQKRKRVNIRWFKNEDLIASNRLSHQECYSEGENYLNAHEEISFKGVEVKREVNVSHIAGEILVRQTTLREDEVPKVRTWLYNPSKLLESDKSLNDAIIALKIAETVINRCLSSVETHSVQGSKKQKAGLNLNIARAKRQDNINSARLS